MKNHWVSTSLSNTSRSLDFIRIVVALIIIMHPLHGFFHLENIPNFGDFISSKGFPYGLFLAWAVLVIQVVCSVSLLMSRFVVFACLGHIFILTVGIWLVHAPNGWYIIGPSTGGMEFSVLMIACLLATLYSHWPRPS